RQRVDVAVGRLDDDTPAVQIVACAAVGVLADRGDTQAVRALRQKLVGDREVQWNAAVALAKLGSKSGKAVLLNMLDRSFWEKGRVQYQDNNGPVDRPFTAAEIESYLQLAADAAGQLDDSELWDSISRLREDPSVTVREHARSVFSHGRPSAATAAAIP